MSPLPEKVEFCGATIGSGSHPLPVGASASGLTPSPRRGKVAAPAGAGFQVVAGRIKWLLFLKKKPRGAGP